MVILEGIVGKCLQDKISHFLLISEWMRQLISSNNYIIPVSLRASKLKNNY